MKLGKIDELFFGLTTLLLVAGFFIFLSASLSLLLRENIDLSFVIVKQILIGGGVGFVGLLLASRIDYKLYRKYAFYIFLGTIILNLLVFIPGVGFEHGGSTRWIALGSFTFQPSEFLRIGAVIYFAMWLASIKDKVTTIKYGFIPLCIIFAITEGILLLQRDTDIVIAATLVGMFFVAGGKFKHLAILFLTLLIGVVILLFTRPYVLDRFTTFLDPSQDPLGAGYQIQQSTLAIGAGGFWGRGFGQSIQKFGFLPEPVGDSIFAVQAEEFGFIGSFFLCLAFVCWATRGLKIALNAQESFGSFLAVGIVLIVATQAFTNIGAMLGVLPLTGVPLPFVSQGGSSLILVLFASGIVLSVSRYSKLQ